MAIHHIIPKHEWKARFGNLKGVNAPDNLSPDLYTEQHAQVHFHYFNEITHIEYDRIAGLTISGQIGKEEAQKKAASFAQVGIPNSEKQNQEHAKFMTGKKSALGSKRNDTQRLEQSIRQKNNPNYLGHAHDDAWKQSSSIRQKGIPQIKVACPHCQKIGGFRVMKRWHFDNCAARPAISA